MKTNTITKLGIILLITVGFLIAAVHFQTGNEGQPAKLKVAWMTSWADAGFVAESLKRTDILEKNGSSAEMIEFTYGPPMVEAALAGEIDALFVGWVPAVHLMSKSDDWIVASRLVYFPMALMAREGTGIRNVSDLKGRKIGVPYATGPYPLVIDSLKKAGLDPNKDVELINLKPNDLGLALQAKQVDAVAWTEPSLTIFKQQGLAYSIQDYIDIGFVILSKPYAEKHPEEVQKFLKALKEAEFYVAQNKDEVFQWFSEDSRFDLSLVKSLKIVEPNFDANSITDIDLGVSQFWINSVQEKIDLEYEEKIISRKVNIQERIQSHLQSENSES